MTEARSRRRKETEQTKISAVARKIDQVIASGKLVAGDRLVEARLMEDLGESRGAVREALRFLAGEGVVELLPLRGARVRTLSRQRLAEMNRIFWGLFEVALDILATRASSTETREALLHAVDRLEAAAATRDRAVILSAMVDYQEAVTLHGGNSYLVETLQRLHMRHYSGQAALLDDVDDMVEISSIFRQVTEHVLAGESKRAFQMLEPWMRRQSRTIAG